MIKLTLIGFVLISLVACVGVRTPAPTLLPTPSPDGTPTSHPTPQPPTQTPEPTELPSTRILFTGDINPGRCVALAMIEADDFTLPYQQIADDLRAADVLVGSLDGSITDRAAIENCPETMSLNGPTRVVEGLQYAGFDVITVATNHAKNCGNVGCWSDALLDSIANLEAVGISAVGGGENLAEARAPVVVEHNGIKFAFLAGTTVGSEMWAKYDKPGTAPLWIKYLKKDIAAAREQADVVIVLAQWGSEYTHTPNWDQFDVAGVAMDSGATLVIGNQAHWVQAVEQFPNGVVAYGLGNFVFDQNWSKKTKQGVVFEAVFRGSELESWQLLPIHIDDNFQARWADAEESAKILKNIEEASQGPPITTRAQP
ncbi:MAG TPA: CapA family protein [Anaerolineales bacterium]|nr:CapA family protein [Anaerolineales bacterium]